MVGAGDSISQIIPRRAIVVPRVQTSDNSAILPLEMHVRKMLDSGEPWLVNLHGIAGSGKTTAIEHLAYVFGDEPRLHLSDTNEGMRFAKSLPEGVAITTTLTALPRQPFRPEQLMLAAWTNDDLVEYLAAAHRGRVQSVMSRVAASIKDCNAIDGSPSLWRPILDIMAADESIKTIDAALTWLI